jgi:acetyl esterase/lipase
MYELASRGYVTAAIEYRLTPDSVWPAQIEDVHAAAAWLRASADMLGLDPTRLVVAGGSAGGHLSAMAALDPALALAGAVLWYPAVDLRAFDDLPEAKGMSDALMPGASRDELLAASPLSRVSPAAPPILSLTGDLDICTTVADITAFHEALDDAGVRNELVVFKGRDHGFDFHPTDWVVCLDRMVAFLDSLWTDRT